MTIPVINIATKSSFGCHPVAISINAVQVVSLSISATGGVLLQVDRTCFWFAFGQRVDLHEDGHVSKCNARERKKGMKSLAILGPL